MKKYNFLLLIMVGFMSSCHSQETIIDPSLVVLSDANFEKELVAQKIDSDGLVNGQMSRTDAEAVKVLNLSHLDIASLVGIEGFINLIYLDCSSNRLTNLDLSKNIYLESLDCSTNQLTALDLIKNPNLASLNFSNNKLKSIIVSGNQVFAINGNGNLLQTISVDNCAKLSYLSLSNNQLSEFVLRNNLNLTELHCNFNKIKTIDLSQNSRLFYLNISNNILTSLDLCKNVNLVKLYCNSNNIANIIVPQQNLTNFTQQNSTLDAQTTIVGCTK